MSLAAPRLDSRRSSGLYVDRVGRTKGSSRLDAGHILYRWESKDQRVPWVRTGRGRRPRLTIHPRPYGGAAGPTTALRARRRRGYTIRSSSGSPAPLDPTRGQRRRGQRSDSEAGYRPSPKSTERSILAIREAWLCGRMRLSYQKVRVGDQNWHRVRRTQLLHPDPSGEYVRRKRLSLHTNSCNHC